MNNIKEGNYTFIGGRGSSVIDYGIVNEEMFEDVETFSIGERIKSDHAPVEISINTGEKTSFETKNEDEEKKTISRTVTS